MQPARLHHDPGSGQCSHVCSRTVEKHARAAVQLSELTGEVDNRTYHHWPLSSRPVRLREEGERREERGERR